MAAVSSSGGVINVYKSDKHELLVRMRVLGEVTQLRFVDLEDGTQSLVASGSDGTVRMWVLRQPSFRNLEFDVETELPGQSEWIDRNGQKLALSPDGKREVCFSDRVLRLRARDAHADIATFEFENALQHISFARKANRVAVSDSTSCRVFDTNNGQCIGELYRGQADLLRVQLSNDGQRLLTWRADQVANVWDVDSQSQLLGIEGKPATNDFGRQSKGREIQDVCLSSDGKQLIQRMEGYPRTQVYQVDSGDLITETDIQIGVATPSPYQRIPIDFWLATRTRERASGMRYRETRWPAFATSFFCPLELFKPGWRTCCDLCCRREIPNLEFDARRPDIVR